MRIRFHPEAYTEMFESALYYERRVEGLGLDFLAAVQQTTNHIRTFPEGGAKVYADVRRRLVAGFPFSIMYRIRKDGIFVTAVMYQGRKPGYWRKRLKD